MENKKDLHITTTVLISYASGMLRPEVAKQVEEELNRNETLRLQYEGICKLMQKHPDEDPEDLLDQMAARSIESIRQLTEKEQKQKRSPGMYLLMAAIVLGVVITVSLLLYRNNGSSAALAMRMIEDKVISPYENTTRGSVQSADTSAWKASFAKSDFLSVIALLESKPGRSVEEDFFLAVSYLRVSPAQPENAEPVLNKIAKQDTEFTSDAWLYLALTQALLNENGPALGSLQHVAQTSQVKELEDRLRK